jgi:hypothetical protein
MGTELREEHQEVILLSDVIDNEIRYAYEVQIISNVNTDNIDRTLYLTDDDVRQYDGASNINIAEDSISIVEFTIILEPVSSPERAFLDYRIVGIDGYEVNSRILLLNVNPEDLIHNSSGSIITYDYVGNGRR